MLGLWVYTVYMPTIQCPCGTKIQASNYQLKRKRYCSRACMYKHRVRPTGLHYKLVKHNPTSFEKGHTPWNKDLPEHLQTRWTGDKVGYDALHSWVEKHKGKPKKCEHCNSTSERIYHWSNKSGKYQRNLDDWQRLCIICHFIYDREHFGTRENFRRKNY